MLKLYLLGLVGRGLHNNKIKYTEYMQNKMKLGEIKYKKVMMKISVRVSI